MTEETLQKIREKLERLRTKNAEVKSKTTESSHFPYTPLTPAQKQLYAFQQLSPSSTAYNMAFAIEIQGTLDIDRLKTTFFQLIQRHELLSSCVVEKEEGLFFTKCPKNSYIFEEETSSKMQLPSIETWVTPFDFTNGPLIHVKLFELRSDYHILFIDIPHLIGDGASLDLFVTELLSLYEAKPLPKLKSNFQDYALWRNELSKSPGYQNQKHYWEKALEGERIQLQYPTVEKTPDDTDRHGELFEFFLGEAETTQLRLACRSLKVTPYMFLMACYQVFLSKICGASDITVGTSVEGRISQFKGTFGLLINSIPIRGLPSDFKTFAQFLQEIKIRCTEGVENQYVWFSDLKSPAHSTPFFQTIFDFHRAPNSEIHCAGLKLRIIPPTIRESKFPLSLEGFDQGNQLAFHFEYECKLFPKNQIDLFVKQFTSLLTNCVNHPEKHLCEIDISLESHQQRIKYDFSQITDLDPNYLFLDAFENQVQKNPDRIAISESSSQLSYRSLDALSSHLARVFLAKGIREGDCIAFHLNRGIHFLIAMVGVFKAGAYYVPLDLNAPINRRLSLLEQCSPHLMLLEEHTDWSPCPSFTIQELLNLPAPPLPSRVQIDPETLAYVIFTSGSTGKPKGAMVEHRGMMNHLLAKVEDFQFNNSEIIAQTSSQTFDVSVWQFLTSLVTGGRVCVFHDDDAWTPALLFSELEKNRVTVFETVPSHMHLLLDYIQKEKKTFPKELRFLILNGESLPPSICVDCLNKHPDLIIANAYGPTECSDDVCHQFIRGNTPQNRRSVPIGLPIRNTPIMIMDTSLGLLTESLVGELCIGGLGVGRGYLDNPSKTAETFVPNPFGTHSSWSHRIYRTGDLAFRDFDGVYEYLGRKDHQIKFNGQRIELGEIEAVISSLEDVMQCVVTVIDNAKHKQLGAYLRLKEGSNLGRIKDSLKKELPNHMIPTQMKEVDSFPYLPSGKLDRKSLPSFDTKSQTFDFAPPKTETEKGILEIWEELFPTLEIGRKSHFFEMGGHSLMATQLSGRVLKTFSIKISIRSIYQHPRLCDLARFIDELLSEKNEGQSAQFPEIQPNPNASNQPFPLTQVQQAYWLGRKGIYALGDVSVHVYSEYDCENLDLASLETAWNKMILRHGALRIVIEEDGNQKILPTVSPYKFEIKDCTRLSEKASADVLSEMRSHYSHEVFPSDKWPLFSIRAAIFPTKTRLFLSFDALIMDGWSVDLLFGEWMQLYRNHDTVLPDLQLSFRDCVLAIEKLREHPLYQSDRKYWTERIHNFPSAPMLPVEKSPDQIGEQLFSRCSKSLPKNQWLQIQMSIQKLQLSPTGFLCFVFSEVLSLFTGDDHFALNLTLFDRPPLHSEIDKIVGDFTTLTLLEIKRDPSLNFGKRAQILQDQLWKDIDHRLFGGVEFIRELSKVRSKKGESTNFPVVLTSVLGLDDQQNVDLTHEFGKEVFSITQTPQVWLDFKAYEIGGDLVVEWDFVKELFRPDFIEAMHEVFLTELEAFASDPDSWLSRQHCLPPISQLQERTRYNLTEIHLPLKPLHRLANGQQDAPAIFADEQILTYNDLEQSSSLVANRLINSGVKPGDLVGVIMEKNWHQPVAAMGILKAGAAYLPIDVHLPSKRIDQLLQISGIQYLVVQPEFLSKIQEAPSVQNIPNAHVIPVEKTLGSPIYQKYPQVELNDIAYAIFTSGSTGTPKGVVMQHGPVANTLCDLVKRYSISQEDRILGLSNLNFDLSVFDIFGTFCAGAALILPSQSRLRDASHWVELMNNHRVTIWNSVPMFMQMLIEFLENEPSIDTAQLGSTLRLVLLSGDWIPIDLPEKIKKHFPNAQIVSLGGATEAAIWSIHYEINPSLKFEKSIPYGYPLANQQFYVLNRELQIVPDRVPGMLYIGGKGLAKEYFKDPEKTKSSFINHPQLDRLYCTGDIGAYHPEIGIEFLGRKDNQVKIQGHRIELGEVEYAIKQHPLVDSCTTLIIGDQKQSRTLVACTVPPENTFQIPLSEKIISDPNQRIEFQLKQNGLESPKADEETIQLPIKNTPPPKKWRKSIRQFSGKKLMKASFENWLSCLAFPSAQSKKARALESHSLFDLLSKIKTQRNLNPIPKYPYPSAGGLYPVQAHLTIGNGVGLPSGEYIFNPKEGLLIKKNLSQEERSSLKLIGKKEAIEPLYGSFSDLFCTIEAGYMFSLLHQELVEHELGYTLKLDPFPELQFTCYPNNPILPQDLEILIYLKDNIVESMNEGWYRFDFSTKKLAKTHGNRLLFHPTNEDSLAIFQNAAGGVFFLNHGDNLHHSAFWSGFFGQKLMDEGCSSLIGSCPLAMIDGVASDAIKSTTTATPIHYLLFGAADEERFSSLEPSEIRSNAYEKMIQEFVGEVLPEYMVPRKIELISSIPLNSNGKVDTGQLAKLFSFLNAESKERIGPRSIIEKKLHEIWCQVLDISEIGIEDSFFELGGNSLSITKMALRVKQEFQIEVPLAEFFKATKIASLAQILEKTKKMDQDDFESDLSDDIQLSPKIKFPKDRSNSGSSVLLTGASGFLGIHILADLIKSTSSKIYCHLRAKDRQSALERLKVQAVRFQLDRKIDFNRVLPVVGDLEKPFLGCDSKLWNELESEVGTIIHNGSFVHHVYDYKTLRNTNVKSTLELIQLCTERHKRMVYISSLLAMVDRDIHDRLVEDFPSGDFSDLYSGYQKTKWASEMLLKEANKRGLDVLVVRPNTISGQSNSGRCSYEQDHFFRLVKGCIEMGYAPIWDEVIDLQPVEKVSQLIVRSSFDHQLPLSVVNLASKRAFLWKDLIEWLNRKGFGIQFITPEKWQSHLSKLDSSNALYPLLSLYLDQSFSEHLKMEIQCSNSWKYFDSINLKLPDVSEDYLNNVFDFLKIEGFL